MSDLITTLCSKLIQSDDDGAEARPTAAELRSAIRRRLERVRKNAFNAFDAAVCNPQATAHDQGHQEE